MEAHIADVPSRKIEAPMIQPLTDHLTFEHVEWEDARAVHLRDLMSAELAQLYPELAAPSGETGPRLLDVGPEGVVATILACDGFRVLGHAAIRRLGDDLEVKRVFVHPDSRGGGVAGALMAEVEVTAAGRGARRLILHTGNRQPAAVNLYQRLGYSPIPLYEPYSTSMPESYCFEKTLQRTAAS